jgi:RTX calcium-binding nonapeptide repeat (4 copies)
VIGDLNSDGRPDLVSANFVSNNVSVLLNTSQPAAAASPASLAFGSHQVGKPSLPKVATITNSGEAKLHVSKVKLEGTNPEDFAISSEECTDAPILADSSCAVHVRFSPIAPGPRSALLKAFSDDPASPLSIPLAGRGINASCQGNPPTIVGTNGSDAITGTTGNDVIVGLGGDDTVRGGGGHDVVCGGGGGDRLHGRRGHDVLSGGVGPDRLRGGSRHDALKGGHGRDRLRGGQGHDALRGGRGRDRLRGGSGDDALRGGRGRDRLRGRSGDDVLRGGRGRDRCREGSGNGGLVGCER